MGEPSSPSDRALRWAVASLAVLVLGLGVAIAFKYQSIVDRPMGPPRRPTPPPAVAAVDAGSQPVLVTVRLETVPPGARLSIDGEVIGESPRSEAVEPGAHLFEATLAGYAPASRTLEVAEGAEPVRFELVALAPEDAGQAPPIPEASPPDAGTTVAQVEPPPTRPAVKGRGKLTLRTKPRAAVYLNGRRIGETPLVNLSVPAGLLTLRLVRSDTKAEQLLEVEVVPNRTTVKRFTF